MICKFVDAIKNYIFINNKDVFSYCKENGVDCCLDDNSRTPNGLQIFVTDDFIKDFNANIRNLGRKGVLQLMDRFNFCFKASGNDGLLTPPTKREGQSTKDNAIEVRIGRANDRPWRTVQSKPLDNKICLTYLFQDEGKKKEESSYFDSANKLFKDEIQFPDSQNNIKSDFDGLDLSPEEREELSKYKSRKNWPALVIKYIEKREETIKSLQDSGFNSGDINDELLNVLIPKLFLEDFKPIRITESILNEANRQQLLQKSRTGRSYKNQSKGKNRFERRTKSSISATVRDYNMIQMDPLFKRDILEFKIPVMGETDVYVVDVRVDGLLAEIRKQLMSNKGSLEFKVILQSLMKVLNIGNVYIGCNCPDARYRQAYWQTQNDYKAGYKEKRPSDKTNPNDDLGAACKHVLLVLANLDWAVKVASVINNYVKYCKEHLQKLYADYIFPKIYGMKYDKAVQLQLFDNGLFPEDAKTMKDVIDRGFRGKDRSGKFVKGNEMRFQKKEPVEKPSQEDENPLDLKFTKDTEEEPENGQEGGNIPS